MKRQSSPRRWKEAGAWLRRRRKTVGLTQLELAGRLGVKYYAFVSQVETGFSRLPTAKLEAWALALEVDPPAFAKRLLSYYEPELYRLLFGTESSLGRDPPKRARSPERSTS